MSITCNDLTICIYYNDLLTWTWTQPEHVFPGQSWQANLMNASTQICILETIYMQINPKFLFTHVSAKLLRLLTQHRLISKKAKNWKLSVSKNHIMHSWVLFLYFINCRDFYDLFSNASHTSVLGVSPNNRDLENILWNCFSIGKKLFQHEPVEFH